MENIGFVGTGAMGSALLSRLKLANIKALAFDIAPSGLAAARAEGAEIAASAESGGASIDAYRRGRAHRPGSSRLHFGPGRRSRRRGAGSAGVAPQHNPPRHHEEGGRSWRRQEGQRHRRLHDSGAQHGAPGRLDIPRRRTKSIFRPRQTASTEHGQGCRLYGAAGLTAT